MNKKIIFSLFVFIGFMFLFNCNNSFATFDITLDDIVVNLPDLPTEIASKPYYIISYDKDKLKSLKNGSNVGSNLDFTIYASDNPFTCSNDLGYLNGSFLFSSCYMKYNSFGTFVPNKDNLYWSYGYGEYSTATNGATCYLTSGVFSNYNVYSNSGDLVFQVAPQEGATTTTLTTMITSQDLSGVTKEILALLPIILATLIILLGLMKAIKLLYKVLAES